MGHIWIRMLGRDWIFVKRRKPTKLGIIGTVLATLGVIGLAWGSVQDFRPERIGVFLAVLGFGVIGYRRLETKNLAADEIYKIAYDRGREDGYDEGYDDRGQEQPARPVVVPLGVACINCGETKGARVAAGTKV